MVPVLDAAGIDEVSTFWAGLLGGRVESSEDWHTVLVDDVTGAGEIQAWGDVGHLFLPSDGTSTPGGHLKPPTMVGDMSGGE